MHQHDPMGMMDSIKRLTSGRKSQVKSGIDTGASAVSEKAGAHADKVDQAAEAAKDAVDKLPD